MKTEYAINLENTKAELETIIDRYTLSDVQEMIVEICRQKAEHITASYKAESFAKLWLLAASRLEKVNLIV